METNWICWVINNFSNWLYDKWMAVPLESAWKSCSTSCQIWNGADCSLSLQHFKTVEKKWNYLSKINPQYKNVLHWNVNFPIWRRITVNSEMMLERQARGCKLAAPLSSGAIWKWTSDPRAASRLQSFCNFSWKKLFILINVNIKINTINI